VTVIAPPRPPRPGDPVDRDELEALVQALIEEARRRARRRRLFYVAGVGFAVLVGLAVFAVFGRTAFSKGDSPAPATRSSVAAGAAGSKIAFMRVLNRSRLEYSYELYVMNADGSGKRRLARSPWAKNAGLFGASPVWSPDGRKLVFAIQLRDSAGLCDRAGPCNEEIFVINADGSGLRRLTWNAVPDGPRIGNSADGPYRDVFVMNADGSGQRNLTQAWSPDGRTIVFGQYSGPPWGVRIFVMNADGSGKRALTHKIAGDTLMSRSPDGRRIAFFDDGAVYAVNADGRGLRRLTRNVAFEGPSWSPDGRKITFVRLRHPKKIRPATGAPPPPGWAAADLYVMNADGSGQRNLTHTPTASDGWAATWARPQSK
jgi:Tol biopolymer transport system component